MSTMSSSKSKSPTTHRPLVWVTVGKESHPALLLNVSDCGQETEVQWTSNRTKQWVDTCDVHQELSPRRRSVTSYCEDDNPETLRSSLEKSSGGAAAGKASPFAVAAAAAAAVSASGSRKRTRRQSSADRGSNTPQRVKHSPSRVKQAEPQVNNQSEIKSDRLSSRQSPHGSISTSAIGATGATRLFSPKSDGEYDSSDNRPLIDLAKNEMETDDTDDDEIEVLLTIQAPLPSVATGEREPAWPEPSHELVSVNDVIERVSVTETMDRKPAAKVSMPNQHNAQVREQNRPTVGTIDSSYWPQLAHVHDAAASTSCSSGSSSACRSTTSRIHTAASASSEHVEHTVPLSSCNNSAEQVREVPFDDLETGNEPVTYTLRSSAYLQNLAEICHTITQDRRWRVDGAKMSALFQWEYQDDLSAVTALSILYIPRRPPPPRVDCTCLLCRDKPVAVAAASVEKQVPTPTQTSMPFPNSLSTIHSQGAAATQNPVTPELATMATAVTSDVNSGGLDESTAASVEDNKESKSMYLYSRLFYRKGPWFRLDDVYSKYYIPSKASPKPAPELSDTLDAVDSTDSARTVPSEKGVTEPQRRAKSTWIDSARLQTHLEVHLPRLLEDIEVLYSDGMIRFFTDEAECGKVVDCETLTKTERDVLRTKLGAAKTRSKPQGGTKIVEPGIWKLMNQRQLSFGPQSDDKKILPVRRHVDDLILDKLSREIIGDCRRSDDIPKQFLYEVIQTTLTSIAKLIRDRSVAQNGLCFRLREAPEHALQRCVRLHLCATTGPGEMRGTGTNGWRSVRKVNVKQALMGNVIPPPGQHTWNQIQYPGLSLRFGLSSACFLAAYVPLPAPNSHGKDKNHGWEQVFTSRQAFLRWEICAELRANVDYLAALNELLRSEARRQAQGKAPRHKSKKTGELVDFMGLLDARGRQALLGTLVDGDKARDQVMAGIDDDLVKWLPALETDTEKVLGTIGIVSLHVLRNRNSGSADDEPTASMCRPWLRHLSWRECMAYLLYDIVPILERRALFELSVQCLEVLLFGDSSGQVSDNASLTEYLQRSEWLAPSPRLLSRRARGKAMDRLLIDFGHIHRGICGPLDKTVKSVATKKFHEQVADFCRHAINHMARASAISFSTLRMLARRLKRPLADSLSNVICLESKELGLRFGNGPPKIDGKADNDKYSDWIPTTDTSIANNIERDNNEPGSRCSFVGFDDEAAFSSLNVEEFAMQLYQAGRLPSTEMGVKGGWMGWHDEGGHVRAIFRILCSAPVLGMDFGCAYEALGPQEQLEHATVHLSPYQQAPFDLHVGFDADPQSPTENIPQTGSRGFYVRRSGTIHKYLETLNKLTDQCVSDLVFDSVACRLQYAKSNTVADPFLERDLMQVRTLSAVAAGLGGKLLAAVFRCLLFDYRHYSGGLPDLHLFRAVYDCNCARSSTHDPLVDLSSWIGESFSVEALQAAAVLRTAALLSDRDDEFLGCTKTGESAHQANQTNRGGKPFNAARTQSRDTSSWLMPARLRLEHNDCKVRVECMLVEVKSSNDRLDPRQEDWLNVLDHHGGNARVCKFEESKKSNKKQGGKAPCNES